MWIKENQEHFRQTELQRMLNDIKTEKESYDALIIYKLDRLSRDSMGLAYIIKILQQKNIK